jgi:glucose/arabinose dehydrogenase
VLKPGHNYGWPIATRGRDYSGATISPFRSYPGMDEPLLSWTPSGSDPADGGRPRDRHRSR